MYEEKVRKFKCYYCPDCNLYAGSETKTIHGRRMKPNTKYCTGGKRSLFLSPMIRRSMCRNGVLSGVCRPHCGFITFVPRKSNRANVYLRLTGFRSFLIPAAMRCGMRATPLTRRWNLQSKPRDTLWRSCFLYSCSPMRFWKSTMVSAHTVSLWNVSVTCGASASKAILHAKTIMMVSLNLLGLCSLTSYSYL